MKVYLIATMSLAAALPIRALANGDPHLVPGAEQTKVIEVPFSVDAPPIVEPPPAAPAAQPVPAASFAPFRPVVPVVPVRPADPGWMSKLYHKARSGHGGVSSFFEKRAAKANQKSLLGNSLRSNLFGSQSNSACPDSDTECCEDGQTCCEGHACRGNESDNPVAAFYGNQGSVFPELFHVTGGGDGFPEELIEELEELHEQQWEQIEEVFEQWEEVFEDRIEVLEEAFEDVDESLQEDFENWEDDWEDEWDDAQDELDDVQDEWEDQWDDFWDQIEDAVESDQSEIQRFLIPKFPNLEVIVPQLERISGQVAFDADAIERLTKQLNQTIAPHILESLRAAREQLQLDKEELNGHRHELEFFERQAQAELEATLRKVLDARASHDVDRERSKRIRVNIERLVERGSRGQQDDRESRTPFIECVPPADVPVPPAQTENARVLNQLQELVSGMQENIVGLRSEIVELRAQVDALSKREFH